MLKFLAERIKKGYMTLEDVPKKYREAVRKLLEKDDDGKNRQKNN